MCRSANITHTSSHISMCRFMRPMNGSGSLHPLQDLVNEVANASGSSRHRQPPSADRYASAPVLASLQVDDSVNLGSRQPSPVVTLKAPPMPALSVVDQSYVTTGAGALGSAPLASPASCAASDRSLQSEALSSLSINHNVTSRKVCQHCSMDCVAFAHAFAFFEMCWLGIKEMAITSI